MKLLIWRNDKRFTEHKTGIFRNSARETDPKRACSPKVRAPYRVRQWRSQDFLKGEANFHGGPKVTQVPKIENSSDLVHYLLGGAQNHEPEK